MTLTKNPPKITIHSFFGFGNPFRNTTDMDLDKKFHGFFLVEGNEGHHSTISFYRMVRFKLPPKRWFTAPLETKNRRKPKLI